MVMSRGLPSVRFNCYLLDVGLGDVTLALRPKYRPGGAEAMREVASPSVALPGARAFLGQPRERVPRWAERLQVIYPELGELRGVANRFVIFLPVSERWFAACFGYGSGAIDWESIEPNFGLRVAARRFRPDDVVELRSRRVDATARTQSVQVPAGGDLHDFGVELEGEFVRKLVGRADATGIHDLSGAIVAGDSIAFTAETDLTTVVQVLLGMLETVRNTKSREEFAFVDSLEPIRATGSTARQLDRVLAAALLDRPLPDGEYARLDKYLLEFAPPDDLPMDDVETLRLSYSDQEVELTEFSLGGLRSALNTVGARRGVAILRSVKIIAVGGDGTERSMLLPLRNWLVFELGSSTSRFILTIGRWFKLEQSYTAKLDQDLGAIDDVTSTLRLPDWSRRDHEGEYNESTAKGRPDLALMDKVLIDTEDGGAFEACDLFEAKGHLIHVKKYTGSQTLSHLFSQGAVSAELLNSDSVARADFQQKSAAIAATAAAAATRAPETVTYAIGLDDPSRLPLGLPTFSKVNLRDFSRRLRRMRVRPTLASIRII